MKDPDKTWYRSPHSGKWASLWATISCITWSLLWLNKPIHAWWLFPACMVAVLSFFFFIVCAIAWFDTATGGEYDPWGP